MPPRHRHSLPSKVYTKTANSSPKSGLLVFEGESLISSYEKLQTVHVKLGFNEKRNMTANIQYPPIGQRVIIHCENFSCLGLYDGENAWRSAIDNAPLQPVKSWSYIGGHKVNPASAPVPKDPAS
jgi:hypothetical protein